MSTRPVIVVTGADGFVGRYLTRNLSELGRVVGVSRRRSIEDGVAGHARVDISVWDDVKELKKLKPDIVVHAAAMLPASADDFTTATANELIDRNIIRLVRETGARVVFMSSISVYESSPTPWHERTCLPPFSAYAIAKYDVENRLAELSSPAVSLRLSSPYGAIDLQRRGVLFHFMREAAAGRVLKVIGEGSREQDFVHAHDIARAVSMLIQQWNHVPDSLSHEVFNIASGQPVSMRELAELVINAWGDGKVDFVSGDGDDSYKAHIDISHAKNVLGWEPVISLQQGVSQLARRVRGDHEDWLAF